ncbi:hypothetical protein D3C72_1848890 [compost metagenome]
MQHVDEGGQAAGVGLLDPQRSLGIQARQVVPHRRLVMIVGLRVADFPAHAGRNILGVLQMDAESLGHLRPRGQGPGDQIGRGFQRRQRHGRPRRGPAGDRLLEHRQRACVKGDEERHAGQDAGPGVDRFVDAYDVGSHGRGPPA